jgi:hypothetical protein
MLALVSATPQKQRDRSSRVCVGSSRFSLQMRYFHAVSSRSARQRSYSASVIVGFSLADVRPGVEAESPSPLVHILRDTGAHADIADADVAVIDVPTFLVRVVVRLAGEGRLGHATNYAAGPARVESSISCGG